MGDSGSMRADDAEGLLAGYVTGPAAATEATAMALARADAARAVVLVEGVSDQIAVETERDRFFSANEAKEFGLVDEVIQKITDEASKK